MAADKYEIGYRRRGRRPEQMGKGTVVGAEFTVVTVIKISLRCWEQQRIHVNKS